MFARAFALLFLAVAASVAATVYFGNEVLIALGLILTQAKMIVKKIGMVELPAVLAWIKSQADVFLRVELLKKWVMTTLLPLVLGRAALRRIAAFLDQYRAGVRQRYMRLLRWYRGLHPVEKVVAALIILSATIALSVTSLGLWLILFSVKIPLWIAAVSASLWRMTWLSVQKMVFKALAFFQLRWLWRGISRVLPGSWLAWKRRLDYRVARAVIRRRRMTVRQLADRKDSLPFRMGILVEFWTGSRRPAAQALPEEGNTMRDDTLPLDQILDHLDALVRKNLHLWDVPEGARVRLINVSENATFLIQAPDGRKTVLRVHRTGYHSRRAIECELAWMAALSRDTDVRTPGVVVGRDGALIQSAHSDALGETRFLVMFQYLEGAPPDESGDMTDDFKALGAIAAACHDHALGWQRPEDFERLTWDDETVFGPDATWGNWRDAPGVTDDIRAVLERVETVVRARLAAYGKGSARFNLIHADMRLANLLVGPDGTQVIDFDDCGFGWLMYDFAAAISFIEDDPQVPNLKAAWLKGYRRVRDLPPEDEAEMDTMIMLRRMALLAWIGSHIEAPEPQALAPDFAERTAKLGQAYLEAFES